MSCPTCRAIQAVLEAAGVPEREAKILSKLKPARTLDKKVRRKVKRGATKYQKELGKQLKRLKKKHPRTAYPKLMKRAHAATRKKVKK
jgi:hypothetical protein